MGIFAEHQPVYARAGIATVPFHLAGGKRPAVRSPDRIGLAASARLAAKFPEAEAFAFAPGPRSGVTIFDIDTGDEAVLRDTLRRRGDAPIIASTPSGGFHVWYAHGGETGRRIRAEPFIDILAGGLVVAPPSKGAAGAYEFIRGGLDDLDALRCAKPLPEAKAAIPEGQRNRDLFNHLMREARFCDDLAALLDVAETFAERFEAPMEQAEIIRTANSVWGYEQRGENRFGRSAHTLLPAAVTGALIRLAAPEAAQLWLLLWSWSDDRAAFPIANGLAAELGWSVEKLRKARRALVEAGMVELVRAASTGRAALYRWGRW